MDWSLITIIIIFFVYYLFIFIEKKMLITEPKEIIMKFLAVMFLFAGISLIYFSITGEPLLSDTSNTYNIYIFIIGFIAVLWTTPYLLKEFQFFRRLFYKNEEGLKVKRKRKKQQSQ